MHRVYTYVCVAETKKKKSLFEEISRRKKKKTLVFISFFYETIKVVVVVYDVRASCAAALDPLVRRNPLHPSCAGAGARRGPSVSRAAAVLIGRVQNIRRRLRRPLSKQYNIVYSYTADDQTNSPVLRRLSRHVILQRATTYVRWKFLAKNVRVSSRS